MADNITDNYVATSTVEIPGHTVHPSVKYNPLYWIKKTDTITVTIGLNGNTQKEWSYTPNGTLYPSAAAGTGLLFDCKLAIVEANKG